MTKSPDRALHKHIRIVPERWRRIESAAAGTVCSSDQLFVELSMEALDRRESIGPDAGRVGGGSQARPSNTRTTAGVSGTNSFKR